MRVKEMRNKRQSYTAIYTKYTRLLKNNEDAMFCFVEGKYDDKYYRVRLEQNLNWRTSFVYCGGKTNVIELKEYIDKKAELKNKKKAFFVDLDYDKSIRDDYKGVYETPYYSVENFYTGIDCIGIILESRFGLYKGDKNYNKIIEIYTKLQNQFHDITLDLNTWIACQRRLESSKGERRKLSLDSLSCKELYKIDINGIECKYDIPMLNKKFPNAYTYKEEIFNSIRAELNVCEKRKVFRGKFEFDFLCEFLKDLITKYSECKKGKNDYFCKEETIEKTTLQVSSNKDEMLASLSIYAETPECLKEFCSYLKKEYQEVI